MNWISEKAYVPFLVLISIILVIGFINRNETLDINVHDTYFVINNLHLTILLSILLGIIALGYFLSGIFSIPLINWMTISHVLSTLLGILLIIILFKVQMNLEPKTGNIEFFLKYSKIIKRINIALFSILGLTILSQLLFLINVIIGLKNRL